MKNDVLTFGVLNDKYVVGLIGLVPARLHGQDLGVLVFLTHRVYNV